MQVDAAGIRTLARPARLPWWLTPIVTGVALGVGGLALDDYVLYVAASWLIFGILALSLDLVWGSGGIMSLGHTSFFGLGGYLYGIVAINLAPAMGDTLVWALLCGGLAGAASAAVVGYFMFYGRLGPIQISIVTYTLTLVLWTLSIGVSFTAGSAVVGGDNGMSNIPSTVLAFGPNAPAVSNYGFYIVVLALSVLAYIIVRGMLRTPFGMVVESIRTSELKTEVIGYDVRRYQQGLFALSGAVAGVAGALYASWATYINPTVFSATSALLVPIYVLVGGRGTLIGGFVGAILVGGLSFWLGGGVIGGETTLVLGLVLILLVIAFPKGLIGGSVALLARLGVRPAVKPQPATIAPPAPVTDALADAAPRTGDATQPILRTVDLSKSFGGVLAVGGVTLDFQRNQVRCLIGPNGAGKSTFLLTCMGICQINGGKVYLGGVDVTYWPTFRRVRAGLGIKLQVARVLEDFTTYENLWLAGYSRVRDRSQARAAAEEVLRLVHLEGLRDRLAAELSHGEQQWLDIGMVLCLKPTIILLDEPTAGMTPEETRQTAELVRQLSTHAGIVVVDHDMEFVRMLDSPVTVLHQGRVFAEGTIEELHRDERILDIYLGRRRRVKRV